MVNPVVVSTVVACLQCKHMPLLSAGGFVDYVDMSGAVQSGVQVMASGQVEVSKQPPKKWPNVVRLC